MAKKTKVPQNNVIFTYYVYSLGGKTTAAYCVSTEFFSIKNAIVSHSEEGKDMPVVLSWQDISEEQLADLIGQEKTTTAKNKALGLEQPATEAQQ